MIQGATIRRASAIRIAADATTIPASQSQAGTARARARTAAIALMSCRDGVPRSHVRCQAPLRNAHRSVTKLQKTPGKAPPDARARHRNGTVASVPQGSPASRHDPGFAGSAGELDGVVDPDLGSRLG